MGVYIINPYLEEIDFTLKAAAAAIMLPDTSTRTSQNVRWESSPVSGAVPAEDESADVGSSAVSLLSLPPGTSEGSVMVCPPPEVSAITLTVPETSLDDSSSGIDELLLLELMKHSPSGDTSSLMSPEKSRLLI